MSVHLRLSILPALLLAIGACGPTQKPAPQPIDEDPIVVPEDHACTRVTAGTIVLDGQNDVQIGYSAKLSPSLGDAETDDFLVLQFVNQGERQEVKTGTFPLGAGINENNSSCAECILVYADQRLPSEAPGKIFFADRGSITLQTDPGTRILRAQLTNVRLVEVTIEPSLLESTPVEGGECLVMDDLSIDYGWIPPTWSCGPETYGSGGACDCACGAPDPDCWLPDETPNPDIYGCLSDEACVQGVCVQTCDTFTTESNEVCREGTCSVGWPADLCVTEPTMVDAAAVGGFCGDEGTSWICGVDGDIGRGFCDVEATEERLCRPVCRSAADCGTDEICFTVVGGAEDGKGKGYCRSRVPSGWTCEADKYEDGAVCDCLCGAYDPDCGDTDNPVANCPSGQACFVDSCG